MRFRSVWLVLLCVALGFGLANILSSPSAIAQVGAPNSAPRFQVSAFAGNTAQGVFHGAYVIDTMTGKVWQVRAGGDTATVAEKLP
jgi:ABC-type arginine transport system permease subunit